MIEQRQNFYKEKRTITKLLSVGVGFAIWLLLYAYVFMPRTTPPSFGLDSLITIVIVILHPMGVFYGIKPIWSFSGKLKRYKCVNKLFKELAFNSKAIFLLKIISFSITLIFTLIIGWIYGIYKGLNRYKKLKREYVLKRKSRISFKERYNKDVVA